ncbi:Nucleoporin nup84 [Tilletia horrida]|nr:Nucleoporin nup84 [Tilletia horrida]
MPAATRSRRAQGPSAVRQTEHSLASSTSSSFAQVLPSSRNNNQNNMQALPSIYDTFADIFFQSQPRDDVAGVDSTEELLHPEHGTALQYAEACKARVLASASQRNEGAFGRGLTQGEYDDEVMMDGNGERDELEDDVDAAQWNLEYNTWLILHRLSIERTATRKRKLSGEPVPTPSTNAYHPALLRASDVLAQSSSLRELDIVRQWLQSILDPYQSQPLLLSNGQSNAPNSRMTTRRDATANIVEVRKGYWTFTKNALRAAKRTGQIPPSNSTTAGSSNGSGGITPSSSFHPGPGSSLFGGIRKSGVGIGGGAGSSLVGQKLLRTMDPDAPCRPGEGELAPEDMAYERAFLRSLFLLVRAGKLGDALELCVEADRPWRAASLRGALPYFDPQLVSGTGTDQQYDPADLPKAPQGNRNRALWKATARKLAGTKSLDPYERALYGALSGSLEPVLECCSESWEEAVWAYVNAKLEAGVESGLRKSVFAQRGPSAATIRVKQELFDDDEMDDNSNGASRRPDGESEAGDEARRARVTAASRLGLGAGNDLTLRPSEDESALDNMDMEAVFEHVDARVDKASNSDLSGNAFRAVQRVIITGDVRNLLVVFDENIDEYQQTISPRMYARYVRFFAHVVLYLRSLRDAWIASSQPANGFDGEVEGEALGPLLLPEPTCDNIIREYIQVLRETRQSDRLVALYSSTLLEKAAGVVQYAAYLLSLDPSTSSEARSRALARAAESHLNLGAVARRTVELIFSENLPHFLPSLGQAQAELGMLAQNPAIDLSAVAAAVEAPNRSDLLAPYERQLLHGLEWLTFSEETYGNAVVRCNELVRLLLASGRLAAARQAVKQLPPVVMVQLGSLDVNEDIDIDGREQSYAEDAEWEAAQDRASMSRRLGHVEHLECLSWGNLFDALDAYHDYLRLVGEREKYKSSTAKQTEFAGALSGAVDNAERAIKAVLEGDWLRFNLVGDEPENYAARTFEYKRIRQLFIPELVFSLHLMLFDSRDTVSDALARALTLPNLIADASHALWQDFIPATRQVDVDPETSVEVVKYPVSNRLPEYLEAVRQAELVALDSLGPDPFQPALLVSEDVDVEEMS